MIDALFHLLSMPSVAAWFVFNLLIGLAYLHIPVELWGWARGKGIAGMHGVVGLFVVFIIACGLHHLVMLRSFGHHPVDGWQLLVDGLTMAASITTSAVLWQMRRQIHSAMSFFRTCHQRRHEVEDFLRKDKA